jgi:nitrous oxidase accessory protein NosD
MKIMLSKALVFAVIVLFVGAGVVPSISSDNPNLVNTIYVDDDGGADFTHIQNAIDASRNGDTIFVYGGIYNENLVVDKSVTLVGEDKELTIIDGNSIDDVIYITSDYVKINGFTIRNSGIDYVPNDILNSDSGVDVQSNYVNISNNIIINNHIGVSTRGSSSKKGLMIYNNLFINNSGDGQEVKLAIDFYACYLMYTDYSKIHNNEFYGNDNGIRCSYSNQIDISRNRIYNMTNEVEFNYAILFKKCHSCNITDNEIHSAYYGICFGVMGSPQNMNTIAYNSIKDTEVALCLCCSQNNTIIGNMFLDSVYGAALNQCSNNNIIYDNDFINNDENAFTDGGSVWFDDLARKGNFWDDYSGSDSNGDGVGDTPYEIPGDGGSQDMFPLMMPVHNVAPSSPNVFGPSSGKAGEEQVYVMCSNDLNDDKVFYFIDWGDGETELWSGPFGSSEEQSFGHMWDEQGEYTICVRAKDDSGLMSDWTELEVTMPKNKAINTPFLNFLENHPHLFPLLRHLLKV